MSLPAVIPLHHDPAYPVLPQFGGSEPPIFLPLPETDIGYVYRGDTIVLPDWFAVDPYQKTIVDLTGAFLWFTAKTDLELDDDDVDVIQQSTRTSGIEIIGPPVDGRYRVTIGPDQTHDLLDDTVFIFDCQVITTETHPRTLTIKRGVMTVVRDVTRASS